MLQHSVSPKKQWQYLLIIPMLLGTLHSFAFENSITDDEVSLSDTIPNIKKIMVTDTIITFDPNTFEEEIRIVTSEQQFVEVKDTIFIFDPNTLEEQMRIVKRDVPLGEYLKEIGIKIPELKNTEDEISLSNTTPIPDIKKIMVTDTIFTFDPNTLEEEIRIVTSEQQFVEVKDTIFIFDPNTLEEHIRILERDVPLDEYLKEIEGNR